MAVEWISAAKALRILCVAMSEYDASTLLIRRAGSGQIAARAELYLFEEEWREGETLPAEFWRDEVIAPLSWSSGDFEKQIRLGEKEGAYGVSFDRNTVLELAP